MLFDGVDRVGPRRIRGRWQHVLPFNNLDDIWGMAPARALGVEGVNGAVLHGGNGVFDKARFIERVCVDHHLHVHVVGH